MNRKFLPEISFCTPDTATVEAAVITKYEELAGITLYPGDPVRLFLESVSYLLAQQNNLIDFTGKQNLLHYASGNYLDYLSGYLHTTRQKAQAARTILVFTLSAVRPDAVVIPKGTRVRVTGTIVFATDADAVITKGDLECEADAVCLISGSAGNGFLPGQLKQLIDPIAYVKSVVNSNPTNSGTDSESDENLRTRTALATESYGSAGSIDAYRYQVKSVHQGIVDEAIWQKSPGSVFIAPLMSGGAIPSDEIIAAVHKHLNRAEIKPFTDEVTVVKPARVESTISLSFYILLSYESRVRDIIAEVDNQVEHYIDWQRSVLGRDILPGKLIEFIQSVDGVQRVIVREPVYKALNPWQVGHVSVSSVSYAGLSDE